MISPLATHVAISPNRYSPRAFPVTKVTVHHMAGDLSVEACGRVFAPPSRQASSNYGVGSDGRVACYVDEADAAWTSSDWDNDNRAVTIEVADADTSAWAPSAAAYEATAELVADICRRNGIPRLDYTGGPDGTLTEHRMFAATSCPGPWWHARMGEFADEVNRRLAGGAAQAGPEGGTGPEKEVDRVRKVSNAGGEVYRLYDPNGGKHHYTASAKERGSLVRAGWRDEGVAWAAPKGGERAVYRMYDARSGDHLYTASFAEAEAAEGSGYAYEGVPFFGRAEGSPVFRAYNPNSGEHFYTADAKERDGLVRAGWNDEGVAFRV